MKTALVFPGQGSQFPGMGKDLYESNDEVRALFEEADSILGFRITDVMFGGSAEDLRATAVTQPAVFLHSVGCARALAGREEVAAVAGHSLGEFSALVVCGALSFEDALRLVKARADAMQKCCDAVPGGMAAVIGLPDETVEQICADAPGVVPANYNCPGQIVISGSLDALPQVCARLKEAGARRALTLGVGGAFHSPLMQGAAAELSEAIARTTFSAPVCPIYQNVSAAPETDPERIKENLLQQLTSPVRWTQSVRAMLADGIGRYVECGPGKVLSGLIGRISQEAEVISAC